MDFTEQQIERYSRHIILPDVGGKGQKKLAAARVLVIGAGGLGSPAAHVRQDDVPAVAFDLLLGKVHGAHGNSTTFNSMGSTMTPFCRMPSIARSISAVSQIGRASCRERV